MAGTVNMEGTVATVGVGVGMTPPVLEGGQGHPPFLGPHCARHRARPLPCLVSCCLQGHPSR